MTVFTTYIQGIFLMNILDWHGFFVIVRVIIFEVAQNQNFFQA